MLPVIHFLCHCYLVSKELTYLSRGQSKRISFCSGSKFAGKHVSETACSPVQKCKLYEDVRIQSLVPDKLENVNAS
jgi:hypothetical protein